MQTRPEFLKLKCLIKLFHLQKIKITVIKINQHVHLLEDTGYYNKIINIDELCDNRLSNIGSSILTKLPEYIKQSTHILAQGDTASVFYSMFHFYKQKGFKFIKNRD